MNETLPLWVAVPIIFVTIEVFDRACTAGARRWRRHRMHRRLRAARRYSQLEHLTQGNGKLH